MASMSFLNCSSLLLLISAIMLTMTVVFPANLMAGPVGINYGRIANNLPSPEEVVPLVGSIGATRVKLYDADPSVLRAFANSGVEFTVALGNEYLSKMKEPSAARAWLQSSVQKFLPATKVTSIAVGNEVLTFNDSSLSSCLLPAMQSLHQALQSLGLERQISITTAHSLAVLQTSYPPSAAKFRQDLVPYLCPILAFLSKIRSPFLINAYPYFAYKANPKQVPLDYVLFQPNQGTLDSATNLRYDNMLFAQIDAVYFALEGLGFGKTAVEISETGWPSKGDADEPGATVENAKKYNGNLIKLLASNGGGKSGGTPRRPSAELSVFVFALFNENQKPGPTSERNYGLFKPDGTAAYPLGFSAVNTVGNSSAGGGAGAGAGRGGPTAPPQQRVPSPATSPGDNSSSAGYLSISLATNRFFSAGLLLFCCVSCVALLF